MSATIDERVVEMKFDNEDFEKNVQTSMSTLQQFKDYLNKALDNTPLTTMTKATKSTVSSLSDVSDSVVDLHSKMSLLDQIPLQIARSFGEDVYGALKKVQGLITAIPRQIATGGWKRAANVEQAKFQLQGLGIAFEELSDDIDHAVNDTRFGADAAARAASMLAASGITYKNAVKDAEGNITKFSDMGRALHSISAVASQTNSEYEDIANIFTTIAGQGKLMTRQMNQLAYKGLNVAATLGEQLGYSEAEIREMVTKGKIDFMTFADAMEDAFGENAQKANETFDGALANMKASLSRIGQDYAATILQQTPQVFNALKGFFNGVRKFTRPIAENLFTPTFTAAMRIATAAINKVTGMLPDVSKLNVEMIKSSDAFQTVRYIVSGLTTSIAAVLQVIKPLKQAIREVFNNTITGIILNVAKAFNRFANSLIMSDGTMESMKNAFKGILSVGKLFVTVGFNIAKIFSPLVKIVVSLAEAFIKIAGVIGEVVTKITDMVLQSTALQNVFKFLYDAVYIFSVVVAHLIDEFGELASNVFIQTLIKVYDIVRNLVKAFGEWAKKIGLVNKVFKVLALVALIPLTAIIALGSAIATLIANVLKLEITQKILGALQKAFTALGNVAKNAFSIISTGFTKLITAIKSLNPVEFLNTVKTKFVEFGQKVENFFVKLLGSREPIDKLKEGIKNIIETIKTFFSVTAKEGIASAFTKPIIEAGEESLSFANILQKIVGAVVNFAKNLDMNKLIVIGYSMAMITLLLRMSKAVKAFGEISSAAAGMFGAIKGFFKSWSKKEESKIMQIAKAILILTASLAILSQLDQDKLNNATKVFVVMSAALAGMAVVFTLLAKTMKKNNLKGPMNQLILIMFSMSAAMIAMCAAVKILESVTITKSLLKTLGVVLAATTIFMAIGLVASRLGGKGSVGAFASLLSFAIALLAMAKALQMLSTISWTNIESSLEAVMIVMGGLTLLAFAASKMGIFSVAGLFILVLSFGKIMPLIQEIFGGLTMQSVSSIFDVLNEYIRVVKVLGLLAVAMVAVAGASGKGVKKFGTGMLALSVAFLLMVKGIKTLMLLNPAEVNVAIGIIKQIFGMFALLGAVMLFGGDHATKIALAISAMVLCLYPLAGAIYILGSMDPVKVLTGMKAIRQIMLCFALIMGAASLGKKGGASFLTVLALVSGMVLIVGELIVLTLVPYEDLNKAANLLMKVMLSMTLLVIGFGNMAKKAKPSSIFETLAIIMAIAAVAAALMFLTGDISIGGNTFKPGSAQQMITAALSLRLVLGAIRGIARTMNKMDNITAGKVMAFLFLTASIAEIAAALMILTGDVSAGPIQITSGSWGKMLAGAIALDLVLNGLRGVVKTLNKFDKFDEEKAKAFTKLAATCLAIGVGFAFLTGEVTIGPVSFTSGSWGKMLAGALAFNIVLLGLRGVMKTINKCEKFDAGKAGGFLLLSMSIIAIGYGLSQITEYKWTDMLTAVLSVDLVLLALAIVMKTLSTMNGTLKQGIGTAVGVIEMIAILAAVTFALKTLMEAINNYGADSMVTALEAIAGVLVSLAAVIGVAALLGGAAIVGAIAAVVSIGIFIEGLILLLQGLSEQLTSMETEQYDKLIKGMDMLVELGGKIGEGIGEFIGNLMKGITASLPEVATNLSEFATNLEPFTEGMAKVDESVVQGAIYMGEALAALAGGEFLQGLVTMFTGNDMSKTATGLSDLGKGITAFADSTSTITNGGNFESVTNGAVAIVKALGALAIDGVLDAFTGWLTGKSSLEGMADKMKGLGEGIAGFAKVTDGISGSSIEGAAAAGLVLSELMKSLPNEGGLWGKIWGENSITQFTKDTLRPFGEGIVSFVEVTKGLSAGDVDGAVDVASKIFALNPPNEGGFLGELLGNNDYDKFDDKKMSKFAGGLVAFVTATEGLNTANIDGVIDVANKIFALDPPNEGGLIADIIGDNTYKQMGTNLSMFGAGMSSFAASVSGITSDSKTKAQICVDIFKILSTMDFGSTAFTQEKSGFFGFGKKVEEIDISGFTDRLDKLGSGLEAFYNHVKLMDASKLQASGTAISSVVNALNNLPDGSKINNFKKAMEESGGLGLEKFIKAFTGESASTKIGTGVTAMYNTLTTFMRSETEPLVGASHDVVNTIATAITANATLMNDPGQQITHFFAQGILAAIGEATEAAVKVVTETASAASTEAIAQGAVLYDAGKDMFDPVATGDFTSGIEAAIPEAKEAAEKVVKDASDKAKEIAGIEGGELFTSAADMAQNVADGLWSKADAVKNAAQAVLNGEITLDGLVSDLKDWAKENDNVNVGLDLMGEFVGLDSEGIWELADSITEGTGASEDFSDGLDDVSESLGKTGGAASKAKNEIQEFNDSLLSSLESKTGGMSFFNKLELKAETSAESLLENMRSNVNGITDWTNKLQQLMARGLDKGLVKTLADAGLDSYDQISAFLQMTDDQLLQANDLFLQASAVRSESAATITNDYFNLGKDNMSGFANGMAKNADKVYDETKEIAQEVKAINDEEFDHHSPSGWFRDLGDDHMIGLCDGMNERSHLVYEVIEIICNRVKEIAEEILSKSAGSDIGSNFTIGIAEGLNDSAAVSQVEFNASKVASIAAKASAATLQEKSPSRLGYQQGKFWDLGLAGGISDYGNLVEASSIDVAYSTIDAFSSMTDEINAAIGDIDPVVSPLLDTTRLQGQMSGITSMFNAQRANLDAQMNNDWSNPSVRSKFMEDLSNAVGKGYADRVVDAINNKDNSAQVYLEGDAAGVFKVVNKQNRKFIKRTGYSGM